MDSHGETILVAAQMLMQVGTIPKVSKQRKSNVPRRGHGGLEDDDGGCCGDEELHGGYHAQHRHDVAPGQHEDQSCKRSIGFHYA